MTKIISENNNRCTVNDFIFVCSFIYLFIYLFIFYFCQNLIVTSDVIICTGYNICKYFDFCECTYKKIKLCKGKGTLYVYWGKKSTE